MGKGFNNYMSKKDFHPSAIWNLKRVFMKQQEQALAKKTEEERMQQHQKEQEMINNKALLGDEKAKMGLSFMYDAPAGIRKEEKTADPTTEPKFEWQRKYNAPREAWAKGNEDVQDQPFGIQVRNVRCVKCHKWGHINTDRECPLFNMSGSKEEPGFSTNPSDIIRQMRKSKGESSTTASSSAAAASSEVKQERIDPRELVTDMGSEYGITLKKRILEQVHADEAFDKLGRQPDVKPKTTSTSKSPSTSGNSDSQQQLMFDYLKTLSDKERSKIFKKFFESDTKKEKSSKEKKDKHKKKSKEDKKKTHRRRHDSSSEDERSPEPPRKKYRSSDRKRHDSTDEEDDRRPSTSKRSDRDSTNNSKIRYRSDHARSDRAYRR